MSDETPAAEKSNSSVSDPLLRSTSISTLNGVLSFIVFPRPRWFCCREGEIKRARETERDRKCETEKEKERERETERERERERDGEREREREILFER